MSITRNTNIREGLSEYWPIMPMRSKDTLILQLATIGLRNGKVEIGYVMPMFEAWQFLPASRVNFNFLKEFLLTGRTGTLGYRYESGGFCAFKYKDKKYLICKGMLVRYELEGTTIKELDLLYGDTIYSYNLTVPTLRAINSGLTVSVEGIRLVHYNDPPFYGENEKLLQKLIIETRPEGSINRSFAVRPNINIAEKQDLKVPYDQL